MSPAPCIAYSDTDLFRVYSNSTGHIQVQDFLLSDPSGSYNTTSFEEIAFTLGPVCAFNYPILYMLGANDQNKSIVRQWDVRTGLSGLSSSTKDVTVSNGATYNNYSSIAPINTKEGTCIALLTSGGASASISASAIESSGISTVSVLCQDTSQPITLTIAATAIGMTSYNNASMLAVASSTSIYGYAFGPSISASFTSAPKIMSLDSTVENNSNASLVSLSSSSTDLQILIVPEDVRDTLYYVKGNIFTDVYSGSGVMASQSLSTSQAASTTTTSMTSTSTAGSGANLSRKAKRQDGIPSSGSSSGHLELEKVPMPGTISASNGLAVAAGPNKQLYFVNGNAQYVTVPLNDLLASASSAQPPGSNGSGDSNDNSRANMPGSALKGGAIAGIVVGCVVGVALIAGLLWFLLRGRRSRRGGTRHLPAFETLPSDKEMSYTFRSAPNSLPTDVGNDDAVRDLRAITSGIVRQLPSEDSGERLLDPHAILAAGTPILAGAYLTTRDPAVILSRDDVEHQPYASRTIQGRNDYETYTMHYFSNQEVFLRAISIASTLGGTRGLAHHHDAVELTGRRHQQQRFRYLWISSPCVAYQSLQSVLHQEESQPRLVNINDYAYKAWSTYSLLESVANMHANGYVHLQLTPLAFYYRDIENVSDWILADMGYARRDNTRVTDLRLNQYSAPELFATATSDNKRCFRQTATQALDVWSLGALIYQLATGHQLTQDLAHMAQLSRRDRDQLFIRVTSACNDAGTVNASYRTLLEGMLQPDPERRLTAASLLDYWRDANGLYDDEHETTTSF